MNEEPLVLIIEDEAQTRRFLRAILRSHGFRAVEAGTGALGLKEAAARRPAVILLDLNLPDIDGVDITKRLRAWLESPIIVLSVRDREDDKIDALDSGADDYLTKPFSARELLARLRVAVRHNSRTGENRPPIFSVGDLRVDLAKREVTVGSEQVHLTPTEYELLSVLIRSPGKVMSHQTLLETVWGQEYTGRTEYLRVFVAQLRRKLEHGDARPRYLLTEPGIGYRIRPP